jgi:hypothetical protein
MAQTQTLLAAVPSARAMTTAVLRVGRMIAAVTHQALGRTRSPHVALWVPICVSLIPILMTGSWLLADALQPNAYSPVRQSVSVLAGQAGHDRWIVTGALYLVGGAYLLAAAGLRIVPLRARLGLVLAGFAAIGIAAYPEPRHGSTPPHLAFTAFGAVVIAIWPLMLIAKAPARSALLQTRVSVPVAAVFIGLLIWTLIETRSGATLGLAERLSSSTQICWPAVVSWSLLVATRATRATRTTRADPTTAVARADPPTPRRPGRRYGLWPIR